MALDGVQSVTPQRSIPTLRDGTRLSDLFDFESRAVSMRLLSDPEIHEIELERLFSRSWMALAHESEIPNVGDFVVRKLGNDGVIIVRDTPEKINVLLNACTHKGMELERAEAGKSTRFRCPYHSWTFDRSGNFVGAPSVTEMYGECLNKKTLALKKARADTYAGMVFATWDETAPSLDDFLGDIKFYLNLIFDRTDSGIEVVGPPQRWIIPANWKCAAEQFAGDAYHGISLHGSFAELKFVGTGDTTFMRGVDVVTPLGHALLCRPPNSLFDKNARSEELSPQDSLRAVPPHGMAADQLDELFAKYSNDELRQLVTCPPKAGQIFPNCALLSTPTLATNGKTGPMITIRTWHPHSATEIEVFSWTFVERDAPKALRQETRRTTMQSFGSSGFVEQDDAEAWPSIQRAASGFMGKNGWMRYPAQAEMVRPEGWVGGGDTYPGLSKDDSNWNWWLAYYNFMTEAAW